MNPANNAYMVQQGVEVPWLHWWGWGWAGAVATADAADNVHASVTMTTASQTVTTGITQPTCPRCLSVTGGADQTGVVTIHGTDIADVPISESFTMISSTLIPGTKAFKSVTSIVYPPYTVNATKTVVVGDSDLLGLPICLPETICVYGVTFGGVAEATAPTVAVSSTVLSQNTIDLNSALDGSAVAVLGYIYTSIR